MVTTELSGPPPGSILQEEVDARTLWTCNEHSVWVDHTNTVYMAWRDLFLRNSPLVIIRWGPATGAVEELMTSDDPEPPAGSIVSDSDGFDWVSDIGTPAYWTCQEDPQPSRLWAMLSGLRPGQYGPVTVVQWGPKLEDTTQKEEIMTQEPQDAAYSNTGDIKGDTVRLLEAFGALDLARLAEIDSEFNTWSQNRVGQCVAYAVRCAQEPIKVGQERAIGDLKTAWGGFVTALKDINSQS